MIARVPYTMTKFVAYEKVAEYIYSNYVDKATSSAGMQTTVNLGSGLIAGFAAAIVSQPADTMLSKINKVKAEPGEGTISRLAKIGKELGVRGAFGGLGTRLFMVGTLTAGQFASKSQSEVVMQTETDQDLSLRRYQESTWCHYSRDLKVKSCESGRSESRHKRQIDCKWNNLRGRHEGDFAVFCSSVVGEGPDHGHLKQRAKRTSVVDGSRRWVHVVLLYYEWLIWVDMVALRILDSIHDQHSGLC